MKFEKPIAEIHKFGLKDFISASSEVPAVETTKAYYDSVFIHPSDHPICGYTKLDHYNFDNCL